MNELALFAGAGGGILAGKLLGWRTVCAVERDAYAAGVLLSRQNDGCIQTFPIWDDVCTFDGRPWRCTVDVVSGGFPCQAFSTAAAGRNCADNLWPEMARIVADVTPRYVFAENVSEWAIEEAAKDCRSMGYKTRAVAISAKDLGADHVRDRYWLLAYTDNPRELLREFYAETPMLRKLENRIWQSDPEITRVDDGVAYRMDRIKVTGNEQVPIVAIAALCALVA